MSLVYAGIDEAGYGPMYGPLTVGCAVLRLENFPFGTHQLIAHPPDVWALLDKAICKNSKGAKGRLLVNDSKKLKTASSGIKHVEAGVLAFLANSQAMPASFTALLKALAPKDHSNQCALPWQQGDLVLPLENDGASLRICANVLKTELAKAKIEVIGLRTHGVFEDQYNRMVDATGNKASVSFTFVSSHLVRLWESFSKEPLFVCIDRQGGRTHYRQLLTQLFPDAAMSVLEEGLERSAYTIEQGARQMTVLFATGSEEIHLPVALASMSAKYVRELAMERFNHYFKAIAPSIAPTAGYGLDANRWRDEMLPHLKKAKIDHALLRRIA